MGSHRSYLAAAVQMTASPSKEENLAKAETFVRLAAERGAAFIVLPEVFTWRGRLQPFGACLGPQPGCRPESVDGSLRSGSRAGRIGRRAARLSQRVLPF